MTNFCSQCGTKLDADYIFCPNCGHPIEREEIKNISQTVSRFTSSPSSLPKYDGENYYGNVINGKALFGMKISKKEKISAIIWLIAAIVSWIFLLFILIFCILISAGILWTVFCFILTAPFGAWYTSLAVSRFRRSELAKNPTASLIYDYKNRKSNCIALLVVNLVLGGAFYLAVIPSIIDLLIQDYVVQNASFYFIDDKENFEKRRPDWVCGYCGENNLGEDTFCKKCKQYKNTKIIHSVGKYWVCAYCDAENSAEDSFCKNCKQYKCENKDSAGISK